MGAWYSLSERVICSVGVGVPALDSGGVGFGDSLSRREMDFEGRGEEVEKKRSTKGFVPGSVEVRARMSLRCLEDSYALGECKAWMSSRLKSDDKGSMLEVRIIRPWSGEEERRGMSA